jgi:exodeoxyribonuclease VII small subunit
MVRMSTSSDTGENVTFEQAITRLEKIVQAIEQGKVGLEDSIKQFEEGMALISRCRSILGSAEMKIQQLQATGATGVKIADESARTK